MVDFFRKIKQKAFQEGYEHGYNDGYKAEKLSPEEKKKLQLQIEFEEKRLEGLNNILNYMGDGR